MSAPEFVEPAGEVRLRFTHRGVVDDPPSFLFILPVLFVEFLAIAVTRSLLPSRLNAFFGDGVYYVIGVAETVKGLFAFGACPLFGKLSDVVGRRNCLLVTVVGTTAPCWVLAFTDDLWIYVTALGLSGMFAATFTLVFAYISDVVGPDERASAYGLALATLGLSFTIGPVLGAVAAERVGERRVFLVSLALAIFDALFIWLALPESNARAVRRDERRRRECSCANARATWTLPSLLTARSKQQLRVADLLNLRNATMRRQVVSGASSGASSPTSEEADQALLDTPFEEIPTKTQSGSASSEAWPLKLGSFDPLDTLQIFRGDPLLSRIAVIVLMYYSGVWALVTTIPIYVVRTFTLTSVDVGWLLAAYGLSTMVAEGVLVRCIVPALGEVGTLQLGLVAFAAQCVVIALARSVRMIFYSILLSLLSNLVYPAVSSLVARSVAPANVGEALGAINGVKAVTEGFGPLAFAALMANFEHTTLPGAPYLACSLFSLLALATSLRLPRDDAYARLRDRQMARDSGGGELSSLLSASDDEQDEDEFHLDPVAIATELRREDARRYEEEMGHHTHHDTRRDLELEEYRPGLSTSSATFITQLRPKGRPQPRS